MSTTNTAASESEALDRFAEASEILADHLDEVLALLEPNVLDRLTTRREMLR